MAEIHLNVPFDNGEIETLKSGDTVLLSGTIYTARDAAHKRMTEQLENGQEPVSYTHLTLPTILLV